MQQVSPLLPEIEKLPFIFLLVTFLIKVFEICFMFYNYNSHLFSVSSKLTYIEYSSPVLSALQAILSSLFYSALGCLDFIPKKFFSGSLLSLFQLAWFLSRSICTALSSNYFSYYFPGCMYSFFNIMSFSF